MRYQWLLLASLMLCSWEHCLGDDDGQDSLPTEDKLLLQGEKSPPQENAPVYEGWLILSI